MKNYKEQFKELTTGTKEIIEPEGLEKKLFLSERNNVPLVVKHGADPTAHSLHIGHMVPIHKIRQFQTFGHKVIFLLGDFTARIGDPSEKNTKRTSLKKEQVESYMKEYLSQVFRVLDQSKTEVRYNSEWFGKMSVYRFVSDIASKHTIAQLLARDDFNTRYTSNKPIAISEFLYPLLQAYDSVFLKADIEVGGNDQLFNFIVARQLQTQFGQEPEIIVTVPTIKGLDGIEKMSKSLGNTINLSDSAKEMYGKIMSINDNLMMEYYEVLSSKKGAMVIDDLKNQRVHPKKAKENLAYELVSIYHNHLEADKSREEFESQFKEKQPPKDLERISLKSKNSVNVIDMLCSTGKVSSKSEARRLIQQRGIRINTIPVSDINECYEPGKEYLVNIGKRRYFRVSLKNEE